MVSAQKMLEKNSAFMCTVASQGVSATLIILGGDGTVLNGSGHNVRAWPQTFVSFYTSIEPTS